MTAPAWRTPSIARPQGAHGGRVPEASGEVLRQTRGDGVERVLTDNGSSYCGVVHAVACRTLGIRHLRTRPYRPQTNGKAERFIRTLIAGWAYGAAYRSSSERTAALDGWLWYYNNHRRHSALGHKPPIARLNERTNLLGTYTYAELGVRRTGRRFRV
jgi:transposase InsO family protein